MGDHVIDSYVTIIKYIVAEFLKYGLTFLFSTKLLESRVFRQYSGVANDVVNKILWLGLATCQFSDTVEIKGRKQIALGKIKKKSVGIDETS